MFKVLKLVDHELVEIQPNCSLSWDVAKVVITVICLAIAAIAAYFAAKGAWLVLPFSGVEIALVISGFYLSSRKLHHRELIKINDDEIRIFHGMNQLDHVISLNRYWAQIKYRPDHKNWHQDKLYLHSHGEYVEVGIGLNNEEKHKLSKKLKSLIG